MSTNDTPAELERLRRRVAELEAELRSCRGKDDAVSDDSVPFGNGSWLHGIMQTVPTALAVFDRDMHYLVASRPWAEDYGVDLDAILGRSHYEVFPENSSEWRAVHRRVLEGATEHGIEQPFHRADGRIEFINWTATPWREPSGVIGGLILVSEHVSSQVETMARLKESERKFRAIFDHSFEFIGVLSPDGTNLVSNQSALDSAGVDSQSVMGVPFWETPWFSHSPELQERLKAAVVSAARGEFVRFEAQHPTPSGMITVDFSLKPVKDEHGRVVMLIPEGRDITELKNLEQQLKQSYAKLQEVDRLKTVFVNAVSHDLRTPLTSIKGYVEFLEDEIGGPLTPQQREFISQLMKGTQRLENLVDDLLDFARFEAGTFRLKLEDVDLAAKAREIAESLRPQVQEAKLDLETALPAEPLMLQMDALRIERVLTNLINNAIKFTPEAGRITIRVTRESEHARCEIEDSGIGIAPEDAPRLFQRFSQLQDGSAKGGTGQGLSISKTIVEAHEGQIGVRSKGQGNGSTFWFTLPLSQEGTESGTKGLW